MAGAVFGGIAGRDGVSGLSALSLARLDGRALDGEQLLDLDDAQQILLDRPPVGLDRMLGAEAAGEVLVDRLPRRVVWAIGILGS